MNEVYEGIKFVTKVISEEIPVDLRINELKQWCAIFHKYNLAPPYEGGSYGNLSFRIKEGEDGFIITGSRIGLKKELTNDSFVIVQSCDLENNIVYECGVRKPSSESMLHFAIYQNRKDVNAIFHGHCSTILAFADKLKIIQTKNEEPYGTVESVKSVLEILNNEKFFIIKNHGFFALGKSMEEAGNLTLQVHSMCR